MSIENLICPQGHVNSKVTDSIQPELELVWFYGCKFDEDPIKNEQASLETPISHYKSIWNF